MANALVLVGHGSARNLNTRKPICANVKAIRQRGLYDEVRCGLLKQEPHVSITLDKLESEDITVVPFFIADGYYTQQVIPEQMKLCGALTEKPGRTIRYTRSVGSHPLFADLIVRHAREAGWREGDALVVLGHGTPKNPDSGVNVYLQAERVRRRCPHEEIHTQFIDEAPFVTDACDLCRADRIVIVPLFVADGWHVTETIPGDLGLVDGRGTRQGREMIMTSAVGTDPGLVEVILALAGEAEETGS
ncbi:MAG: CbiX/SirB N-terminal domain-containing protein [Kiritimatiellia bacterium]